jgi:hypothetical protein
MFGRLPSSNEPGNELGRAILFLLASKTNGNAESGNNRL